MKYLLILLTFLIISCGGGGGSSSEPSSSSASSSINASSGSSTNTSSNYDKITEDYSNKNWLAFSTAIFLDRLSPRYIGNTYSDSWINNIGTAGIYGGSQTETTILETSEDFSINNKGTLVPFFENLVLPLSNFDFTFKTSDAFLYWVIWGRKKWSNFGGCYLKQVVVQSKALEPWQNGMRVMM